MKTYTDLIGATSLWVGRLCGLLILCIVALIVSEVIGRSLFESPSVWGDEALTYIAGFAYVLGGSYAMLHRGHVSVDLVYSRFRSLGKRVCNLISFVLFSIYCFALIYFGWEFAALAYAQGETSGTLWNPPIWPLKFAIPIGALLLYLQGLANLLHDLQSPG